MSSHHFVKEGQEPALFIADSILFEQVQSLLEWAPQVLVLDTALDDVLSWGIKIDVVFSAPHQIEIIKEKVSIQAPVNVLPYEGNGNAIQTAFNYLVERQQVAVNLVSKTGKDIFHVVENFSGKLIVSVLNETSKWSFISAQHYKKWLTGQTVIKVRKTKESQQISVQGLVALQEGNYQAHKDDLVIIESPGPFWVGETL